MFKTNIIPLYGMIILIYVMIIILYEWSIVNIP